MPSDDWWTGSADAGLQRSLEMGAPLPPGEIATRPDLREARNMAIRMNLGRKKLSAAQAADILARRGVPRGQEASWRLWSPMYGEAT
jgi:hypothetical protein